MPFPEPSSPPPENPYAVPAAPHASSSPGDPASVRQAHITAETNIRMIGLLAYVTVAFALVPGLMSLLRGGRSLNDTGLNIVKFGGALVPALVVAATGEKLRELNRVARIAQTVWLVLPVVACLSRSRGLVEIVLYVTAIVFLWSPKARVVFSDQYRNSVIPATRGVKETPSIGTRALRVVALLGVIFIGIADIAGAVSSGARPN